MPSLCLTGILEPSNDRVVGRGTFHRRRLFSLRGSGIRKLGVVW